MNNYRISKEGNEWAVSSKKTGLILAAFDRKDQAEDYLVAQRRADEQSQVLGDFNRAALIRELLAELA
jgi:hypothetical protein